MFLIKKIQSWAQSQLIDLWFSLATDEEVQTQEYSARDLPSFIHARPFLFVRWVFRKVVWSLERAFKQWAYDLRNIERDAIDGRASIAILHGYRPNEFVIHVEVEQLYEISRVSSSLEDATRLYCSMRHELWDVANSHCADFDSDFIAFNGLLDSWSVQA